MTNQQAFDKVWEHYAIDGNDLVRAGGESYYKVFELNRPKGNSVQSCPVGLLIPVGLYKSEMEGLSFLMVCRQFPEVLEYFGEADMFFLCKLQEAHDIAADRNEFIAELSEIAKAYDLEGLKQEA